MLSVEYLMLNKRRKINIWIYNAIFQCEDIVVKLSITTTIVEISVEISVFALVVINPTVRVRFNTSWFATNQAVINSQQDWLGKSLLLWNGNGI